MRTVLTGDELFGKFRQTLKGNARDTWDEIISNVMAPNATTFDESIMELVEEILGMNAEDNQKEYIRNTEKPLNMKAGK